MKILSLFDGISGLQQAFKNIGIEFDGVNSQYYASEVDKYAIQTTQKNFPNTVQLGDVKNITCCWSDDGYYTPYRIDGELIIDGSTNYAELKQCWALSNGL